MPRRGKKRGMKMGPGGKAGQPGALSMILGGANKVGRRKPGSGRNSASGYKTAMRKPMGMM